VTSGGFEGVEGGEEIEDSGSGEEARAVVTVGVGDVRAEVFERTADEIEAAGAEVGEITKAIERVCAFGGENVATHPGADDDEGCHRYETGSGASPHFQNGVAQAGDEPAGYSDGIGDCGAMAEVFVRLKIVGNNFGASGCDDDVAHRSLGRCVGLIGVERIGGVFRGHG